ncbi:hypothetical protein ACFLSZ_00570 [Candidatus Bipolaricaulota bacterium]
MILRRIVLAILLMMILFSTSANFAGVDGSRNKMPIPRISQWILTPGQYIRIAWDEILHPDDPPAAHCADFIRFQPADYSSPIAHVEIPQHPFMAANWGNNMHCDSYISDAYEASGPLGLNAEVSSRTQGFGGYGTITFDQQGRLVAVYSNGRGFQLELMDPYSLRELASHNLPSRPWYWLLQGIMPWQYIGAGMYFFLDDQDRAIVPTTKNTIQVIQTPNEDGEFELVREYDLDEYVVPMRWPHRDSVAWVLPDWEGEVYWWATTGGVVGTVDVVSGEVRVLRLEDEIIENSFAVAEDGAFILSDRALYRFSLGDDGGIVVDWRVAYDRGPAKKPGHITRGSGTSVTLMGGLDGLVALTDNAEPRIHLQFVKRSDGNLVCSIPVFEDGKSGTDISVAGFEQANEAGDGTGVYSVLIENNWGHHRFPRSFPEPGLTRVDVTRHPDGSYTCEEVWNSPEKGIGVFKLSFGNGLAYMYWRSESCPVTSWYLTAVDFATGNTVYKKLAGKGLGYNNWAGALFLHPDGGIAYSTTIFGLVMIRDTEP